MNFDVYNIAITVWCMSHTQILIIYVHCGIIYIVFQNMYLKKCEFAIRVGLANRLCDFGENNLILDEINQMIEYEYRERVWMDINHQVPQCVHSVKPCVSGLLVNKNSDSDKRM